MKHLLPVFISILLLVSCGPSRHAIQVEMRHPSKSGIELCGKTISTLYYKGDDALQNGVLENISYGFAQALEEEYATGEGSISVSCVERSNGDYASRDSLINLLVRGNSDVVFLFDATFSENTTTGGTPTKIMLYCYDGMSKDDTVKRFVGNLLLSSSSRAEMLVEGMKAGKQVSESFRIQWLNEQYSIAYFEGLKWYEALARAEQFDWKGAMDVWFDLLQSNDSMKRACAEYNIAVACYLLGDIQLAEQWLDRSDEENHMPTLSDALRKRINAKK